MRQIALWLKDLRAHGSFLVALWMVLLGAWALTWMPTWQFSIALWLSLLAPTFVAVLLASSYFSSEAKDGTEAFLSMLPLKKRAIWLNRLTMVSVHIAFVMLYVWWVSEGAERTLELLQAQGRSVGVLADELRVARQYGFIAGALATLFAIFCAGISGSPNTAFLRWMVMVALILIGWWVVNRLCGVLLLPPTDALVFDWLGRLEVGLIGLLLLIGGFRAFSRSAPLELGYRRKRAWVWSLPMLAILLTASIPVYVAANRIGVENLWLSRQGTVVSPTDNRILAVMVPMKWGRIFVEHIVLLDTDKRKIEILGWGREPRWDEQHPQTVLCRDHGLLWEPRLPSYVRINLSTERRQPVDIPALRRPELQKAWQHHVSISPRTFSVVFWLDDYGFGDKRGLYYVSNDGKVLRKISFDGGEPHYFRSPFIWHPSETGVYVCSLSPPGSGEGLEHVWWVPLPKGKPKLILKENDVLWTYAQREDLLSPNGKWLVISRVERSRRRRAVQWFAARYDGSAPRPLIWRGQQAEDVAWHLDGEDLVCLFGKPQDGVRILQYHLANGSWQEVIRLPPLRKGSSISMFHWSRDKRFLLLTCDFNKVSSTPWTPTGQQLNAKYETWLWVLDVPARRIRNRIMLNKRQIHTPASRKQRTSGTLEDFLYPIGWDTKARILCQSSFNLTAIDPQTGKREVLLQWGRPDLLKRYTAAMFRLLGLGSLC